MDTQKDGFQQCYNAQIAVDAQAQIIVAADVGQNAADNPALLTVLDQAKRTTGRDPHVVLADAGYKSEANFLELEARGIRGYVALGREGKRSDRDSNPALKATRRMKRRVTSRRGQERYRKRKHIVEAPFGWIKGVLGFRRFHLRGIESVRGEWNLVCMALNLKRMGSNWAWS